MHLRPVRLALHLGAATVLAGSSVLLIGSPSSAQEAAKPGSYGGEATASAMHFLADRKPQPAPVSDLFHVELPYATTSMDSSGSASATAASLYPGGGFLGAPSLLCQLQVPGPVPVPLCPVVSSAPRYPFLAAASYPTRPDDRADAAKERVDVGPLTVAPSITVAHADRSLVEATTEAGGAGVSGVVMAGSAKTRSKQSFTEGALVVTAESAVTGLDLGAGQLHIDSVRSVATATVDGDKITRSSSTTTITGATAGGVPVTIDQSGIHVAGSAAGGAAPSAANTALAALDASGIKVRLLAPSKQTGAGGARAVAGGLLVTFERTADLPAPPQPPPPLPGTPASPNGTYTGSVTLAAAGVTAFATLMDAFDALPVDVPAGAVAAPPGAVPPMGSTPALGQPSQELNGGAPAAGVPPDLAPRPVGASPEVRPASVIGIDLTGERLRTLALVLLGYPLVVLFAGPLRAPARFPRGA